DAPPRGPADAPGKGRGESAGKGSPMNAVLDRLKSWEGFLLVALIATIVVNSVLSPQYLTVANQINLFQLSIEKIVVALAMTLIIVNAEIDLSVGSMMGLAACAFGWLVQNGVAGELAIALVL